MTKVLYTGSFDPITKGHMELIETACELFDEVIVAVMNNASKKHMFTVEERYNLIKDIYKDYNKVKVVIGATSAVDTLKKYNADAILRGIRNTTDYEYEKINARVNEQISDGTAKTVCLLSNPQYECFSSSVVKEVFNLGKDISLYVTKSVLTAMEEKRVKN